MFGRGQCRRKFAGTRVVAVGAVVVAMLAVGATSSSAVVIHLRNGKTRSYLPLRGAFSTVKVFSEAAPLEYHGGPIMPSNTNYTVYWDPAGAPAYPPEYESGVNKYLEDLAHDSGGVQNVDSVSTQYKDVAGEYAKYESHFGGALIDTNPYPVNGCTAAAICLSDAQLQAELTSYVKAHGLPTDLTHEYFLLTPPGVESCLEPGVCSAGSTSPYYCAYHGDIAVTGGVIIYSNDPYVTGNPGCDDGEHPNNSTSDGVLVGGLSHEHNESITDPELNAWYDASGAENGDKCRTFVESSEFGTPLGTAPDGSRYNQLINSGLYWYQQEWSNEGLRCLQRLGPAVTNVSPTSGSPLGGTTVKITGSNFTGTTEVKFGSKAASFTVKSATAITAKSPTGTGTVDITVTTPAGTSATSSADQFHYVPAVTGVSPTSGPVGGGTIVTITGVEFTGATAVTFGSINATSFTVNSSTSITAISPEELAGTVDIRVTTPEGTSPISSKDKFKFTPTVTGLSPNTGSTTGGTTVTVTGTGFIVGTTATTFKFGSTSGTSVSCSSTTKCTVVSPAHAAGKVDVKATVNKVTSATNRPGDQFTYS